MATFLEVDETIYKEMELCLADISAAQGVKLGKFFDLPHDYFLANEEMAGQRRLKVIQQATELVSQKRVCRSAAPHSYLLQTWECRLSLAVQELNSL